MGFRRHYVLSKLAIRPTLFEQKCAEKLFEKMNMINIYLLDSCDNVNSFN